MERAHPKVQAQILKKSYFKSYTYVHMYAYMILYCNSYHKYKYKLTKKRRRSYKYDQLIRSTNQCEQDQETT